MSVLPPWKVWTALGLLAAALVPGLIIVGVELQRDVAFYMDPCGNVAPPPSLDGSPSGCDAGYYRTWVEDDLAWGSAILVALVAAAASVVWGLVRARPWWVFVAVPVLVALTVVTFVGITQPFFLWGAAAAILAVRLIAPLQHGSRRSILAFGVILGVFAILHLPASGLYCESCHWWPWEPWRVWPLWILPLAAGAAAGLWRPWPVVGSMRNAPPAP